LPRRRRLFSKKRDGKMRGLGAFLRAQLRDKDKLTLRSWSVFAELPDKCRLSIRVDGSGDLKEPIEAVYRFELYIADRRGFHFS
jgi:hypothetical protein